MSKKEQQEPTEGELVPVEREQPETGLASLGDVMNTGQLKAAVKTAETQRAIIKEFVSNQLVSGVDYGAIVGNKPTLLKPGQEKIFSLMKLTSRLEKDTDTLEMLGATPGTVAYLCRVYRGGEEIAQGRGAAVVGDKKRDANSTVKIAEKRARMDACLSLGFSEFFTQDMEDPDYRNAASDSAGNGGGDAAQATPASDKQKQFIVDLIKQAGFTNSMIAPLLKANGVTDPKTMSKDVASALIGKLKDDSFVRPERPANVDSDGVYRDEDGHPDVTTPEGDAAAALAEEGQIVDVDDLSQEAIERGLDNAINNIKADEPF